jgi:hypothetical protein
MVTGFKMFPRTNTHNSKIKATFAKLIYKIIIDDIHTLLFAPLSMLRKIARNLEKYVTQGIGRIVHGVVSPKTSSTGRGQTAVSTGPRYAHMGCAFPVLSNIP